MIDFRKEAAEMSQFLTAFRHDLHEHPELSMQEFRTTEKIAQELERLSVKYTRFKPTGLMCEIKGKAGRTVVLRADIDALPVQETTGLPYASKEDGRMHACGHDTHAAMLLGALMLINAHRDDLKGTVRFIFQPGEENGEGAASVISQGALNGADVCFGIHCAPDYPVGFFGAHEGAALAATVEFSIVISGKAAHGATPHASNDAVSAACAAVQALQAVCARRTDPMEPLVISVGMINGGMAFNVIPEKCTITGTCRYFSKAYDSELPLLMKQAADGAAMEYGCTAHLDYKVHTRAVYNDPAVMRIAKEAAASVVDPSFIQEYPMIMAGDDFGAYSDYAPSAYFFLGGGGCGPGHNGCFTVDDGMLPIGSAIHAAFAFRYLS